MWDKEIGLLTVQITKAIHPSENLAQSFDFSTRNVWTTKSQTIMWDVWWELFVQNILIKCSVKQLQLSSPRNWWSFFLVVNFRKNNRKFSALISDVSNGHIYFVVHITQLFLNDNHMLSHGQIGWRLEFHTLLDLRSVVPFDLVPYKNKEIS